MNNAGECIVCGAQQHPLTMRPLIYGYMCDKCAPLQRERDNDTELQDQRRLAHFGKLQPGNTLEKELMDALHKRLDKQIDEL